MIIVVLTVSLLILLSATFAVFRRRLFLYPKSGAKKFSAPKAVSLFAPIDEEIRLLEKEKSDKAFAEKRAEIENNLILRANDRDFSVLCEAKELKDFEFYRKVLDLLTEKTKLEPGKFNQFVAFISDNELPASESLARRVLSNWKENPATVSLTKVLHIAVLTNSAQVYLEVIETAYDFWRQGKLGKVSGNNLIALFESHYRLLSADAQASGAGFLIKEKLASVRREVTGK